MTVDHLLFGQMEIERLWQFVGEAIEVQRCGTWYPASIAGFERNGRAIKVRVQWEMNVPRVVGHRRRFGLFGPREPVVTHYPKKGDITREPLRSEHVRLPAAA